jgi:hypothetical protein
MAIRAPQSFLERILKMLQLKNGRSMIYKYGFGVVLVLGLLRMGNTPGYAQDRMKPETIEAIATGTGTQVGTGFVTFWLTIYEYSTAADKQVLWEAFQKAQNQGVVNALSKMRAVGHVALTGTLGFDVSFISNVQTPTGRRIRFVTNRKIAFGEAWTDSQSQAFNLSAGEIDLNDGDKKKSYGVVFPAAELVINKEGELRFELRDNPWKLVSFSDFKGTPGVN